MSRGKINFMWKFGNEFGIFLIELNKQEFELVVTAMMF